MKKYVPVKKIKYTNTPPWVDKEVRKLICRKYKALKKYRLSKTTTRKCKLRALTQQVKYLIKCKHREYLSKIENSFGDNPITKPSYITGNVKITRLPTMVSRLKRQRKRRHFSSTLTFFRYCIHLQRIQRPVITQTHLNPTDTFKR